MSEQIRMHDVVEMRKKHPCGSVMWTVTRIGADIKIRCEGCGRVVMMDRVDFLRRRKKVVRQGPEAPEITLGLHAVRQDGDSIGTTNQSQGEQHD